MAKFDKARERDIFRRLADGSLTGDDFRAVEQRLLTDVGFRERYVRAMGVEAGLYEAFSFPGTFPQPAPRKASLFKPLALGSLCATLLLGIASWIYIAVGPARATVLFDTSAAAGAKPVAIVTQVQSDSSELIPGRRIMPGVLTVRQGQIQLEFLNGAQINVEGPAELHVLSVDAVTLISGKAAVRIPPEARGFILSTPEAAIVDLGTEFAVSVGQRGASEVHVVDGEVDVSLLGSDGNTLTSQRVTQAKSLRMSRQPPGLERIESPSVTLPGIQSQTSAPLQVSQTYVQLIHAAQPAIYWRFEDLTNGLVANEMGPRWSGKIHVPPDDPSAIVVRDGVARFSRTNSPRRLEPDEVIPAWNHDSFSLELWVSPDNFHWATLVAVVPEESIERNLHMSLLELPYKCSLVYAPGSFRFVYRHPPATNGGTNLFTDGDCSPGLWHHLVAVKTPSGMKLYLNGQLLREIAEPAASDDLAYRFYVGQLYEGLTDRQLSGAIDEFAVYLRELSEAEVREHYRTMRAYQPGEGGFATRSIGPAAGSGSAEPVTPLSGMKLAHPLR